MIVASGQLDQREVTEEESPGTGVLDGGAEVLGRINDKGGEEAGFAGLGGGIAGDGGGGADRAVGEILLVGAGGVARGAVLVEDEVHGAGGQGGAVGDL